MTEAEYRELKKQLRQDFLDSVDVGRDLEFPSEKAARLTEAVKQSVKERWAEELGESLDKVWKKHPDIDRNSLCSKWKKKVDRKKINRRAQQKRRRAYLDHYGTKRECCGETITEFLNIDHLSRGGTAERKRLGGGDNANRKRMKQGFPSGFQVLCYNCNCSLGHYGYCPHSLEVAKH